jgi:hypothetical protein
VVQPGHERLYDADREEQPPHRVIGPPLGDQHTDRGEGRADCQIGEVQLREADPRRCREGQHGASDDAYGGDPGEDERASTLGAGSGRNVRIHGADHAPSHASTEGWRSGHRDPGHDVGELVEMEPDEDVDGVASNAGITGLINKQEFFPLFRQGYE